MALLQAPFIYYYCNGHLGFLGVIYWFPYVGIFIILALILAIQIFKKSYSKFNLIALIASIIISALSLVFLQKMEYVDWHLRKSERNRIVKMIKKNKLHTIKNVRQYPSYHLNFWEFPFISAGNNISVEKDNNNKYLIKFFIPPNEDFGGYSAFVYCEDKRTMKRARKLQHIEGDWYKVFFDSLF